MKPEKIIFDTPDKTEQHAQKQIEKQKKLVGNITPHKGHTLFEINCTTGTIIEAEYESEAANYTSAIQGGNGNKRTVITKENCLYISTLNKKNARKKYLHWLIQNIQIPPKEVK